MIRSFLFAVCFYFVSSVYFLSLIFLAWFPAVSRRIAKGWGGLTTILLKYICQIEYEVKGRQYISTMPVLYASKHQSTWETLVLSCIIPFPVFILKKELLRIPLIGHFALVADMIPVDRKGGIKSLKKMIEDAKERFAQGRPIIIFPEGTRSAPGTYIPYKGGIHSLYQALDCPVVPIALNSGVYWPRHQFLKRPGKITVEFLPPLQAGLPKQEFMTQLKDTIETASIGLLPLPQLVLLDRDGVINVNHPNSTKSVKEFEFIPGAIEAIKFLNDHQIKVAVVTNQANVGRGVISLETLKDIHAHMEKELKAKGAHIDHIFYCPDVPESNSYRRKPNPGMLEEAVKMFKADPYLTPMIGDDIRDLQAAHKLGCPRHLVLTGHGLKTQENLQLSDVQPVQIHGNLLEAVKKIVRIS